MITAFRTADLDSLPQLSAMPDDRLRTLWVLLVGRDRLDTEWMTAHQIGAVLLEVHHVEVPRQRVAGIISREAGTVARRRRGGRTEYKLMAAGAEAVLGTEPTILLIEPEKALSGIRNLESLLSAFGGEVSVCDPWIDGRTLDALVHVPKATSIRLLTANVAKPTVFLRDLAAFRREHGPRIEVRSTTGRELHDRYIIGSDHMLILGTSLNGFGGKQTFVVSAGPDLRESTLQAFDRVWARSQSVE